MTQAITIQFTPTGQDYSRSVRAYYRRDRRTWVVLAAAGFLLLAGLCSVASYGPGFGAFLLLATIPLALWPAFALVIILWNVGRQVDRNERIGCETMWRRNLPRFD